MTLETTSRQNQLARHDPSALPTQSDAVTAAVHAWVSGLDVAMQGADYIVDTPACPDSFWPLPADVKVWNIPGKNPKLRLPDESEISYLTRRRIAAQTVGFVVRYGFGLGLAPEVSLNGIYMVGGRPSMYADQMVALIKSQGHGHRVIDRTDVRCTVEVCHRNESEWQEFTFTMQDAVTAGYVKGQGPNQGKDKYGKDKTGGNAKYDTDPKAMLYARASSIACKTVFPDVLRGMVTYEEIQDERSKEPSEETPVRAAAAPTTAAAIRARIAAVPAPSESTCNCLHDGTLHTPGATGCVLAPFERVSEPTEALTSPVSSAPEGAYQESAEPDPGPEPLAERTWNRINRRFVELEVVGDGQTASRLAVIQHIIGRPISRGSEMTASEGQLVLDNLAGDNGHRIVAQVLFLADEAAEREQTGEPLAAHEHVVGQPDGEYDPTTAPGWGQHVDGADAGGEA